MKKISIYNSFIKNNDTKREYIKNKLHQNGFRTSRYGDFLVVIGGDGTFLSAIRKRFLENPIFVGINTGNLGFLSEFKVEDVERFIQILKRNDYWIEEFPVYQIRIKDSEGDKVDYFVNDLVVERKSTRILHMNVHMNERELCKVSADGIIFSSSLGSTGYSMSAGGSILLDAKDTLQLTPISPVNSKAYQSIQTPLIIQDKNEFTIFPSYKKQRTFRIVCDGKEVKVNNARFIDIKKSEHTIKILRTNSYNPVENIRHKILNGE